MRVLFWSSVAVVAYAYAGYPLWLYVRQVWRMRPVSKADITPSISIVIAARNEEQNLPAKLASLLQMEYPAEQLEIIVASDGSTDGTNELLRAAGERVRPVVLTEAGGKAAALNAGVAVASGEIVVFMDARQRVAPDAVARLVRNFADPEVGCVSGELVISDGSVGSATEGVGLYWKIEKAVRQMESATGSVVGATGAVYAVRRELVPHIPEGTLLDDVYVPMHVARQGKRVVFESAALAFDSATPSVKKEFRRKVRTLTGNYQLVRLAPWILGPTDPLLFEFISHKLARLAVPFALLAIFAVCCFSGGVFYRSLLAAQVMFYLLALLGLGVRIPRLSFLSSFVVLNAAAAVAFVNAVTLRDNVWHAANSK